MKLTAGVNFANILAQNANAPAKDPIQFHQPIIGVNCASWYAKFIIFAHYTFALYYLACLPKSGLNTQEKSFL